MTTQKYIYDFSAEKNQQLIASRGISFEEIILAIEQDAVLDILPHSNQKKYPNQMIYVIHINNYVYLVPFIKVNKDTAFLKTIFPSRKLTKQYLKENYHEET